MVIQIFKYNVKSLSSITIRHLLKINRTINKFGILYKSKYKVNLWKRIERNFSVNSIPGTIEIDYEYLCDEHNRANIKENILKRNSDGNIDKVVSLWETLKNDNLSSKEKDKLQKELYIEAIKIPNKASPHVFKYGDTPYVLKTVNECPKFNFKPKEFHNLSEKLNILTINKHLGLMTGHRSYILSGGLADLERSLMRYTVSLLLKKGFTLISVPDLLYSHVIERCGMETRGKRSQVYHLKEFEGQDICLSGTAEMALAGYMQDKRLDVQNLPLKLVAFSRCYREEVGKESMEKGVYRVHQFNKVEMFGITANETGDESAQLYKEFVDIQIELYSKLGIHFKVLDMPLTELGNPAYTKTDIEAWIPVKHFYGEISSASNCLDYQSRRLNLKYKDNNNETKFAHTLNGTAVATPRLLISLVASHQTKEGEVQIPEVLLPFMGERKVVGAAKSLNVKRFNNRVYSGTVVRREDLDDENGD